MTASALTITSDERPLVGRVEPKSDEVIAVFRNGKLVDIWDSGDRARALWLKYRPGSLTYARILRSDIRIDTPVPDVLVEDGWVLPQVMAQTFVALNPARRYEALRQRLEKRGLLFMDAVTAELDGDMGRFVRSLFADRTHADVIREPTPGGLGAGEPLLGGLFVVDSVHIVSALPDPQYSELRTAVQGQKVDVAVNARAELNAQARGLSLHEFENPQLVELRMKQEHDRLLEFARMQLETDRLRVEAELGHGRLQVEADRDRLHLSEAELAAQSNVAIENIRNINSVARVLRSGGMPDLSLGIGRPPHPADTSAGVGEAVAPAMAAPVDQLSCDPRLIADWKRAGGPGRAVKGLVRVEEDGAALIVAAIDDAQAAALDLPVVLGQAFPGEDVVVLSTADSLLTWVDTLVHERTPRIDDLQPALVLEEHEGTLRILVGSSSGRAGRVVKAVLDPTTLIVPALCALLRPYDDVTVTTAHV